MTRSNIANICIFIGGVLVVFGIVQIILNSETPSVAPANFDINYVDRNEKTCGEPFHRLNDKTGCNERVTECKSSDGVIVFINSAC